MKYGFKAGFNKPIIWIEAGIHAREWISPAVATFIVRELVEDYDEHPEYLDNFNWYLLPVANPDGYAYTFSKNRMWRKNRSPQGKNCTGVDLNRNWDFHWGGKSVKCTKNFLVSKMEWNKHSTFLFFNFLQTCQRLLQSRRRNKRTHVVTHIKEQNHFLK